VSKGEMRIMKGKRELRKMRNGYWMWQGYLMRENAMKREEWRCHGDFIKIQKQREDDVKGENALLCYFINDVNSIIPLVHEMQKRWRSSCEVSSKSVQYGRH
jgi:hypothetical protein